MQIQHRREAEGERVHTRAQPLPRSTAAHSAGRTPINTTITPSPAHALPFMDSTPSHPHVIQYAINTRRYCRQYTRYYRQYHAVLQAVPLSAGSPLPAIATCLLHKTLQPRCFSQVPPHQLQSYRIRTTNKPLGIRFSSSPSKALSPGVALGGPWQVRAADIDLLRLPT